MEVNMKIALGIHIKHDRGACLIIDGKVVVNIANERLDRIKYSSSPEIPYEAVDAVLDFGNIDISQVSCIGISGAGLESEKVKQFYKDEFFEHYHCESIPFFFVSHHLAHAYSVYYSAPFDNSLIFIAYGEKYTFQINKKQKHCILVIMEKYNSLLRVCRISLYVKWNIK